MKIIKLPFCAVLLILMSTTPAQGQTYVKLNGLYALAGVINPAVEFTISPKSTFQTEVVYSPWKSVCVDGVSSPMKFLIFMNEYRRYFKSHNEGWYLGGNVGVMAFNMTKPLILEGQLSLKKNSSKGYGFMLGITGGYSWVFKDKWILDVYAGWAWANSHYNGYALVDGLADGGHMYNKGELIHHKGDEPGTYIDPFNGSGEWLPNKIGVSFGIKIFDPAKRKNRM